MKNNDVNTVKLEQPQLRILIVGYNEFSQLVASILPEYFAQAQFKIVDSIVGNTQEIQQHISEFSPDVVVSAGSNARYLQSALSIPVVAMRTTEWDIFAALEKASRVSRHIHLISFASASCAAAFAGAHLGVSVTEHIYLTPDQAREQFHIASQSADVAVVGASLACGLANSKGLPSFLIYSERSCRATIKEAIYQAQQVRLRAKESALVSWLRTKSQTPIIMVDESDDALTLNNAAKEHLNLSAQAEVDLDALIHPSGGKRESDGECEINGEEWWYHLDTLTDDNASKFVYQLYRKKLRKSTSAPTVSPRHKLVFKSKEIDAVLQQVTAFSASPSNVLLFGESGTGKELVARQIYQRGPYAKGKFVALNCSAIPSELFEGELFGHQDGAYTGSKRGGRKGLIEEAENGALFLDEISELALDQQAKLLRFLQERSYRPLGGNQEKNVDLKLIAASNRSLSDMVISGEFREDLYYRLNVFNIAIPPLRARPDDILHIAKYKLTELVSRYQLNIPCEAILPRLEHAFLAHEWPGNIRELENVLERVVAYLHTVSDIERLTPALPQIAPELCGYKHAAPAHKGIIKTKEEELILAALARWQGDKRKAAQDLGISPTTLWRRLKTMNHNNN
ncbi:hypothetical protein BK026_18590 [Alteromonas sp. V450]|uniref:sigma 54-interacting transcriptional regulator n=1 Tax=Alteromonas sp. V450 TaxID=1912139 RepID=UPI0008FF6255|nr:sigma 54-interacting transcriptional regulator [Alteromonas sp. V450]OJF70614.1 hypothetical protein BK026_18590 [Alteromonas sp. V450]